MLFTKWKDTFFLIAGFIACYWPLKSCNLGLHKWRYPEHAMSDGHRFRRCLRCNQIEWME